MERLRNYKTLAHPELTKKRITEIIESPIYKIILSEDGNFWNCNLSKKDEKLNDFVRVKQEYFDEFKNENQIKMKRKYKIFLKDCRI